MEEWKRITLKDATDIIGDGLHGTPVFDSSGEYYFVNGNNLVNGIIDIKSDTKRTSFSEFEKYKKHLTARTLLVSINGTIGNTAKYRGERIVLGKSACYLNIKPEYDLDYIYYVLCSEDFQNSIKGLATGTTIKNVSLKTIREYSFCIPPLERQKHIGHFLRLIDDKIALNNRINHNLEEQAQTLYKSWFVDFEPFKDGKFVDSELGMIPEGWQVKNLLEVASVFDSKRKPLSGNERSKMDNIYPYYGATSIMDYVDDYIFDGTYLLMGEDGSVMTEEGFPFLQYVTGKFWPNNHAHVMQGCSGFSTEMLHCALLRKVIKSSVTGAVQAKISQANMKKILFVYPPKAILTAFDDILQKVYCQKRNISSQNSALSLVRDNMLPRLISGQLDI